MQNQAYPQPKYRKGQKVAFRDDRGWWQLGTVQEVEALIVGKPARYWLSLPDQAKGLLLPEAELTDAEG